MYSERGRSTFRESEFPASDRESDELFESEEIELTDDEPEGPVFEHGTNFVEELQNSDGL